MNNPFCIVTGAARGIGATLCSLLRDRGWTVLGVDLAKPKTWNGPFVVADLETDGCEEKVRAALDAAKVGQLDGLVNNAGVCSYTSALETTSKQWERVMNVNLRAPFFLSKALFPALKKGSGSIVNISSVHGAATSKDMSAYAASKGALLSLTRALAIEWGSAGIRVNAVLPGAVETDMLAEGMKRSGINQKTIAQHTPLARIGQTKDIANAVAFLLSKEASFITGQTLVVDGGALSQLSTE